MKILDQALLRQLSTQAKANPRLRQNYNLHESYDEASQRLLNAMEPGSYIRPHRHLEQPKAEGFVAVCGRLALVTFDEEGVVARIVPFGLGEAVFGVDLPWGVWHTVVSLAEDSAFYETKQGPYLPIDPSDMAPWAPAEGSPQAVAYLARLEELIATSHKNP